MVLPALCAFVLNEITDFEISLFQASNLGATGGFSSLVFNLQLPQFLCLLPFYSSPTFLKMYAIFN